MKLRYMLCPLLALAAWAQQPAVAATAPVASAATAPNAAKVPAGSYTLDKAHASLTFRVNHLGFSNYTARFKRFDARLQFDPADLTASSVTATVDPRSLDLDNPPPGTTMGVSDTVDVVIEAEFSGPPYTPVEAPGAGVL